MPTVKDLTDYLETIAPTNLQESYDNAGLIVGNPTQEITGVLTTLDCTEAIVVEAVARGCNVVVAHHPIVFRGLKRFNGATYVERTVIEAINRASRSTPSTPTLTTCVPTGSTSGSPSGLVCRTSVC